VDLSEDRPRLLRPGGITPEQLMEVLGDLVVDKAVTAQIDKDAVVKAPGMKYRHYAPDCQVVIVDGDLIAAQDYIGKHFQPGNRVLCFAEELEIFRDFSPLAYGQEKDPDSLMAGLFAALRELDDPAIGTVFARCPVGSGKALAVQNRLGKAAAFTHINPRTENRVIGITGGTGCGKSTLLSVIQELGGTVIDCDEVYHRLLEQDRSILSAIDNRFPGVVENGVLNRKKLGNIVFADEAALKDLNAITHAAVKTEVQMLLAGEPKLAAIDAIGLIEGGLAELCDVTVAVTAPVEDRVRRIMARDGIPENYARSRIAAQHPDQWFREKCDHILENDGDIDAFATKCVAFLRRFSIIE
jgi:dephospho-CoA kinase